MGWSTIRAGGGETAPKRQFFVVLNPTLNRNALADEFRRDQRIRIRNVLLPEVAERVREICAEKLAFDYVYFLDDAIRLYSEQELASLDAARKAQISQALMQNATRGVGYLYCSFLMNESRSSMREDQRLLYDF